MINTLWTIFQDRSQVSYSFIIFFWGNCLINKWLDNFETTQSFLIFFVYSITRFKIYRLLEDDTGLFEITKCDMAFAHSVVCFCEVRIYIDSLFAIIHRKLELFCFQISNCTICIISRFVWKNINGLTVQVNS